MNNSQFRDLVKNDKSKPPSTENGGALSTFVPRSLGSRARSSVPMTPRTIPGYNSGNDFTWRVTEHTRQSNGEPALKKFRSSAAPKGTRLADGYQDRAKLREDTYNEETSREKKLKDLEKMLKDEKIDQTTFDRLRDQMGIGGDLSTTHLVKGLDFKLLNKMRKGEGIDEKEEQGKTSTEEVELLAGVEDELDSVLDKTIEIRLHKIEPTEDGADPKPQPVSMTREEILRQLKESRTTKAAPPPTPEAALGERFRKVAAADRSGRKKFIEVINGRRREVLIITKRDGTTKRKTRWIDPEDASKNENAMPLGMEVPAEFAAKQQLLDEQQAAEDDDDDIFTGVGDYDPLQDLDSESDGEDTGRLELKQKVDDRPSEAGPGGRVRNYFVDKEDAEIEGAKFSSFKDDPNLMAALKRAAALRKSEQDGEQGDSAIAEAENTEKHQKFLARLKKEALEDAQDMDLGFGESRFGDEDDENGPIYDGEEEGGGKSKRKRAPKKRKGDKDSVADVMGVLEGRKK